MKESAVYNQDHRFKIFFTNISSETITLKWEVISNDLVDGWDCYICDNMSCCKGVPQNGAMPYIYSGFDAYLALNVNPKAISGAGTLKIFIYDEENPSAGDTLTWIVNSTTNGIQTIDLNSSIAVFPNPASDYVTIDMRAALLPFNTIALYNTAGQLLIEKTVNSTQERIDLTTFPEGSYRFILRDKQRNQAIKTVIRH